MNLKRMVPILLVGAALVIGLSAFSAVQSVSADTATPPATGSEGATTTALPPRGGHDGLRGGYTSDELAAALNITTDQLTQAYADARSAALTQAVKDGLITQAQADELNAQSSTALHGGMSRGLKGLDIDFDTYLAVALNIRVDELTAARAAALQTHVAALVADGAITQEQADWMVGRQALMDNAAFNSALQGAFESAVSLAVKDGVITQAQAAAVLAQNTDGSFFGLRGMGKMDGGHRH